MKASKLSFSEAAASDILEQADWYEEQSDRNLSRRWQTAVTRTISLLMRSPLLGQLCHFGDRDLAELRRIPIAGFPKHLLFYKFANEELLIVRIIHGARDLNDLL